MNRHGRHQDRKRSAPELDYLRVSVTDRCNYRCRYCIPPGGHRPIRRKEILGDEQIVGFTRVAAGLGVSRVRITGGEPLTRPGIPRLVRALARVPGIDDIAMTTNGSLLAAHARELKQAGLRRVNISIDSLDEQRHRAMTGGASLAPALQGVEAALEAGLEPVKVNTVIMRGLERELDGFIDLMREYPLHVRFIELMPINGATGDPLYMTADCLYEELGRHIALTPAMAPTGAGPARYYRFDGAAGSLGFISLRDHFCRHCNRLRLTADGRLRECLFATAETDIRHLLSASPEELEQAVRRVAARKRYDWRRSRRTGEHGAGGEHRSMAQIGG